MKGQRSLLIKEIIEIAVLFFLLFLLVKISYSNIHESLSVIKYHLQWHTHSLLKNYDFFLHSHNKFLLNTLQFPKGGGADGFVSAFYLLPLFIFSKLFGGLSLTVMYLFTVTSSIILLVLFYYWIRKFWDKETAFFAAFFLGYSAIFQEIARSGTYISFSLLFAIIWIIYLYKISEKMTVTSYFPLGVLTGIGFYGYGLLRGLFLVACLYIILSKDGRNGKKFLLFLTGMMIVIIPGVALKISMTGFARYKDNPILFFFDKEYIRTSGDFVRNIGLFWDRMLGGRQVIEPLLYNNSHAPFLDRLLVLPFLIGIAHALKKRHERRFLLLLVISLVIYLTPLLFTSSLGYREARRSLMYVIPTYIFIGFGMSAIFNFVGSLSGRIYKYLLRLVIFGGIAFIMFNNFLYFNKYIISSRRDIGILNLADQINNSKISGGVYYFERVRRVQTVLVGSLYMWELESEVLRLSMMGGMNGSLKIWDIGSFEQIKPGSKNFYLIKSPYIPEPRFETLCKQYHLSSKLLMISPITERTHHRSPDNSFRLYYVTKEKGNSN